MKTMTHQGYDMAGWYRHSSKITRTGAVLMVCAVFSMQLACRTDISDRPQDGDTDSGAGDMSAMVDAGDMLERMDLATEPDLALDLVKPVGGVRTGERKEHARTAAEHAA